MGQKSHFTLTFAKTRTAVRIFVCLVLCIAQSVNALPVLPPARASTEQLLQMKEKLTVAAERIVKGKLLSKGLSANEIAVNVEFDFDKEKLRADSLQYYQSWYETQVRQASEDRKKNLENQKNDIKEVAKLLGYETDKPTQAGAQEKEKKANKSTVPVPTTERLGSFNLDLLGMSFPDPVNAETTEKTEAPQADKVRLPFTLGIQISGQTEQFSAPPIFTFDLADYLTDVRVELIFPLAVPPEFDSDIRKALATGLGIKEKFAIDLEKKIAINRAPPPKETNKPTYLEELFKPQSALIPAIAASVIAGTLLLAAAFLLLTGISKLAVGLSELKPKEATSQDSGSGKRKSDEDEAPASNLALLASPTGSDAGAKGSEAISDPNALSRIFAADMPLVRNQITEIVKQDANAVAEIIRDIANSEDGLADMKDLVTFVGFEILRPALDALPKKLMEEFSASIEDDEKSKFNPLNGIELAQRVNRDFLARSARTAQSPSESQKSLRRELLLLENDALATLVGEINEEECVLLLKTLSLERAQGFFKKIRPEVFKNAYLRLDDDLEKPDQIAKTLIQKMTEAKNQSLPKGSVGQKRVMLKILKNSTPEDEEFIQSLVASDDWEMKSLIMKTKFLFRDLPYVQPAITKQVFESFPISFRGELYYCSNDKNKQVFLNLYPETARARELLTIEVSQIEKNDKRRTNVEKNKNLYIQKFLEVLHQVISSDPANYEEIMLRIVQNEAGATSKEGQSSKGNDSNAA